MQKYAVEGVSEPTLQELIEEANRLSARLTANLQKVLLQLERRRGLYHWHIDSIASSQSCIDSSRRLLADVNRRI